MTDPSNAQRRDWWSNNWECVMPEDPIEVAQYEAELADAALHGPAAGQEETP